jgi:hypothetical protein
VDWIAASKHTNHDFDDKSWSPAQFKLPPLEEAPYDVVLWPMGERFESFFFPRPSPLPLPRKQILQVLADALFHLSPERHAFVGFDTLVVAVHILWRWWALQPCKISLPLILGFALLSAESVLGVGHCATSLDRSIVSFIAHQLNIVNPNASRSEFDKLFIVYTESVQGRLVDPNALPRFVPACNLEETSFIRDAKLVPAFINMLDQEETWVQFGDSSMRLILEQVFVRFVSRAL